MFVTVERSITGGFLMPSVESISEVGTSWHALGTSVSAAEHCSATARRQMTDTRAATDPRILTLDPFFTSDAAPPDTEARSARF